MLESTTSFLFPDINVWLALTAERHVHHPVARDWLADEGSGARLYFSRFTQLGLLRLLTVGAIMGEDVLNQREAWRVYDRWRGDARVYYVDEPADLEPRFRSMSRLRQPAPKDWADSYLAAFAAAAQFTLVTFDVGFRTKAKPLLLLGE
jgi:toxin-antitoxin system PIN domain toxin